MSILDVSIIASYLIFTLIVGFYSSKGITNMREYAIGDRNFSTLVLIATICATAMSGSGVFITASEVFKNGIVEMFTRFGIAMMFIIYAYNIAPKMKPYFGKITIGEVMREMYGESGQVITGIASVLFCAGMIGGQIRAMGNFFNYFLDLPIYFTLLVSSAIILFYSVKGGIKAVTYTDVMQFITLAVTIPIVYNIGLEVLQGYQGLTERIPAGHKVIIGSYEHNVKYITLFMFFLLPTLNPTIVQRMLMAKDTNQIKQSYMATALAYIFFIFISGMIGLIAFAINPTIEANKAFMFLLDTYLPNGLKGLAFIGIIAVVMSTADSYINLAGISFSHDIIRPVTGNKMTDSQELKLTKIITLLISIMAICLAIKFDNIFKLILFTQSFYVPVITGPFLLGLYGFRSSPRAFLLSVIAGITTVIVWNAFKLEARFGMEDILPGITANLIVLFSTHYLAREKGGWIDIRTLKNEDDIRLKKTIS